jgi:hypothetical protein
MKERIIFMEKILKEEGINLNIDWKILTISEGSVDIHSIEIVCREEAIPFKSIPLRNDCGQTYEIFYVFLSDLGYRYFVEQLKERNVNF